MALQFAAPHRPQPGDAGRRRRAQVPRLHHRRIPATIFASLGNAGRRAVAAAPVAAGGANAPPGGDGRGVAIPSAAPPPAGRRWASPAGTGPAATPSTHSRNHLRAPRQRRTSSRSRGTCGRRRCERTARGDGRGVAIPSAAPPPAGRRWASPAGTGPAATPSTHSRNHLRAPRLCRTSSRSRGTCGRRRCERTARRGWAWRCNSQRRTAPSRATLGVAGGHRSRGYTIDAFPQPSSRASATPDVEP